MSEAKPHPLHGIKVIELGTLIAGPFCARLLAEFGAEVIKIEPPQGGDPLRNWRKLYQGKSLWWYAQARNKKSVTLDLKHAEAQAKLRELSAKPGFERTADDKLDLKDLENQIAQTEAGIKEIGGEYAQRLSAKKLDQLLNPNPPKTPGSGTA